MKNWLLYICAILGFVACQDMEVEKGSHNPSPSSDISVIGRIPSFEEVNVATRGTKSGKESKVTNMYMFILDNANNVTFKQFEESDKPLFTIDRTLLEHDYPSSSFTKANILIVANVNSTERATLAAATTLAEIEALDFGVSGIDIPEQGFPMMGSYEVDLHNPGSGETDALKGSVLEIPLDCIYAKIVFNISVRPLQSIAGVDQSFQLKSWKVFNVPTQVRLGEPAADAQTHHAEGDGWITSDASSVTNKSNNLIYESSQETDSLSFFFYMPEHKINPKYTATYPWDTADNEKYADYRQYLKPTLVKQENEQHQVDEQKATYVEINGIYKDHNNTEREVTYTIYLGADNYQNFHILRDHQYNNNIIIKGIKNSTAVGNENWVTYDHRVNVTQKDFSFGLQRETLLDSHWEIRPIRIDFNKAEATDAVVEIIVPDGCDWLSIESPSATDISGNAAKYCEANNTSTAYGKRRYYTTNLNTELNGTKKIVIHKDASKDAGHTIATLNGAEAHTVWAYIDEHVNTADNAPQYRYATITCNYYASEADYNNGNGTPTVSEEYIFRQNNLHKITYNGNTYFIEYYEEYLYNFDSKEQYGKTTDGMAWGLNGEQLSNIYEAVAFEPMNWTEQEQQVVTRCTEKINSAIASIVEKQGAKYDFYLPRDFTKITGTTTNPAFDNREQRDHSGLDFTKDIIKHAEIDIRYLTTDIKPNSAVEYCLNRNKRIDDQGNIELENIKWYMPAIDEIEDICMGGYGDFEVFQDKWYWSSQPAYKKYEATFHGYYSLKLGRDRIAEGTSNGSFFADDTARARATKVNDSFDVEKSGSVFTWGSLAFEHTATFRKQGNTTYIDSETMNDPELTPKTPTSSDVLYEPGNQPRTAINRVRCVYYVEQP